MIINSHEIELDELDIAILQLLQKNGRIRNLDLAQQINLSPPATHTRVKRLEEYGYIRDYVALLDWASMGFDMICFIQINLQTHQPEVVDNFRNKIIDLPEVLECHHITGDSDYLLKVAISDRENMEHFIVKRLTPISGVARIHTSIALSEIKSTTALPIR